MKESNKRLAICPPSCPGRTPSYAGEKSLKEPSDANTAMGTLMALFYAECNAHRELAAWFKHDVRANSPPSPKAVRTIISELLANVSSKNKDVNLDTILKTGSLN